MIQKRNGSIALTEKCRKWRNVKGALLETYVNEILNYRNAGGFSFRAVSFFTETKEVFIITHGMRNVVLKRWGSFEEAIEEIERLGNQRVSGDCWINKNIRISRNVLKSLYDEIMYTDLIKEIYRACELLGFDDFSITALGETSCLKDMAYLVGWKGIRRFTIKAPTFKELIRKLQQTKEKGL